MYSPEPQASSVKTLLVLLKLPQTVCWSPNTGDELDVPGASIFMHFNTFNHYSSGYYHIPSSGNSLYKTQHDVTAIEQNKYSQTLISLGRGQMRPQSPYLVLIPGTWVKSNNVVSSPSWGDSSATYGQLSGRTDSSQSRGRGHASPWAFRWQFLVRHGLGEGAPAPLSLFQSVQDKLAGVNESLHAVDKARFRPGVQLRPRFVQTFLLETHTHTQADAHQI